MTRVERFNVAGLGIGVIIWKSQDGKTIGVIFRGSWSKAEKGWDGSRYPNAHTVVFIRI